MSASKLDRGTKIYIAVLGAIALAILIAWVMTLSPRVWQINDRLEQEPLISDYPFPFRVLEIDQGVAAVASPRSPQVSAMQFLSAVDPSLRGVDLDSPKAVAAQKQMAAVQKRVRELVEAEPDIEQVRWQLDKDWFAAHGIQLQP